MSDHMNILKLLTIPTLPTGILTQKLCPCVGNDKKITKCQMPVGLPALRGGGGGGGGWKQIIQYVHKAVMAIKFLVKLNLVSQTTNILIKNIPYHKDICLHLAILLNIIL